MKQIDFNGETFQLLSNSETGQVDKRTTFRYEQEGDLVTADYSGGSIIYGEIIAQLQGKQLNMLYN